MNRLLRCLSLILFILLLFCPTNAFSESPFQKYSPLLVSQHGSVFVVIHEGESANLADVIAKMEDDIHALEVVFRQMLNDGRLDGRHRTLVINAGFYGSATARFSHATTRLYRTNRAALFGFPISLAAVVYLRESGDIRGEMLNLGRAYVIDTSTGLLSLNDLMALIHLLPTLDDTQSLKELRNEAELSAARKLISPGLVEGMSFAIGPPWDWSVRVGREYFTSIWQGGVVTYYLRTTKEEEKIPLPVLPYYLQKPVWGGEFLRLLAYASREELVVKDIIADTTERIDLQTLLPKDYHAVDKIELYSNVFDDELCIVLSGDGFEPVAFVWRVGIGLLGQSETVPTELNPAGWALMHRGTHDFSFRDIRLDTGRPATIKSWGIWLTALAKAILWVVLWSVVLVVCFGLPYVLAHLISLKLAHLAKVAVVTAALPVLSATLFVVFAALVIFVVSKILPHEIGGGLPLPWGDPTAMRADLLMLVVVILYVPATVTLAVLNGWQLRVFMRGPHTNAGNRKNWDFWGMGTITPLQGRWRLPLHCYVTLFGCLLLVAILFASQVGVLLDREKGLLIFCLIVLIPYTFARPLSLFVARKFR